MGLLLGIEQGYRTELMRKFVHVNPPESNDQTFKHSEIGYNLKNNIW